MTIRPLQIIGLDSVSEGCLIYFAKIRGGMKQYYFISQERILGEVTAFNLTESHQIKWYFLSSPYPIETCAAKNSDYLAKHGCISAFSPSKTPFEPCHWTPGMLGVLNPHKEDKLELKAP